MASAASRGQRPLAEPRLAGPRSQPAARRRQGGAAAPPSRAFVRSTQHYNRDSDGEMDEDSSESAWVFPRGLAVGSRAHYYSRSHSASGFPRYGAVTERDEEFLAEGVVITIDEKQVTEVTFTWDRAVQSSDKGKTWSLVESPPAHPLVMIQESRDEVESSEDYRRGGRRHDAVKAEEMPEYTIKAPRAAWTMLGKAPRRVELVVVTLLSSQAMSDGRRQLEFATLSGEQFGLDVDTSISVEGLAALVREARGLSATVKIVQTDGSELFGDATLADVSIPGTS